MALDEVLLKEVGEGNSPPTVRFLQFKPAAALVGYNQDVSLEIREDYCRENGLGINRRLTGGGAIFFQESDLGWEIFGEIGGPPFEGSYEHILQRICSAAAGAISGLGVEATFRPRNDIEVMGRKISGTGGASLGKGLMFQGTLLVNNDIETFVRALRIPVEKLKKREIESLLDRVCFLNDLLGYPMAQNQIKEILARGFSEQLNISLKRGGLTAGEEERLQETLPLYSSDKWIRAKSRRKYDKEPIRSILQTSAGTIRVHLWLDSGGRRIEKALISGDFFANPPRLVHDLEAFLKGLKLERESLKDDLFRFMDAYNGAILGVGAREIAEAIARAADRLSLVSLGFSISEANQLFFVNTDPMEYRDWEAGWLLLPYCSKDLDCQYRAAPGCDECGECEIGTGVGLGRSLGMTPVTIQSFEHLMTVLERDCNGREALYVGSCCEAFYSKHQKEMERINARGVLVNLDSTTCYDLGKGTLAYNGEFDNKTALNLDLMEKVLRTLNGTPE
jgi:lipoate-protein ligase A